MAFCLWFNAFIEFSAATSMPVFHLNKKKKERKQQSDALNLIWLFLFVYTVNVKCFYWFLFLIVFLMKFVILYAFTQLF